MDDNINIHLIQTHGNFEFTKLYTEINHYEDEKYHYTPFKKTNECKYLTAVEFSKVFQSDILCKNCRSLEAHWDSLQELFCNLSSDGLKLDIIGFTEVFRIRDLSNTI